MAEEKIMAIQEKNPAVLEELIREMFKKNELLELELDVFKDRSPLVGIRWYGDGGYSVGLRNPIHGVTKLVLKGYGDKGVIDYQAWQRIRSSEEVYWGIVVRDDSVVEELGTIGKIAKEDVVDSPNARTREQLIKLVKGPFSKLEQFLNKIDHHWVAFHCRKLAKEFKVNDARKISLIEERYGFLLTKFRYALMHKHDLKLACEYKEIQYDGLTDDQMIQALATLEMKTNPSDFFHD